MRKLSFAGKCIGTEKARGTTKSANQKDDLEIIGRTGIIIEIVI